MHKRFRTFLIMTIAVSFSLVVVSSAYFVNLVISSNPEAPSLLTYKVNSSYLATYLPYIEQFKRVLETTGDAFIYRWDYPGKEPDLMFCYLDTDAVITKLEGKEMRIEGGHYLKIVGSNGYSLFAFNDPVLTSGYSEMYLCPERYNDDFDNLLGQYKSGLKIQDGFSFSAINGYVYYPAMRTLTITYQYEDGTEAAPPYSGLYPNGSEYLIPSPEIEGHTPDRESVAGVMGEKDETIFVVYQKNASPPAQYLLTIRYEHEDGSPAFEPYTSTLEAGVPYRVTSPSLVGYRPEQREVAGEMPEEDLTVTVVYREDRYSIIENYTPYDGNDLAKHLVGIFPVILPACVLIFAGLLAARLVVRVLLRFVSGGR